MGGLGQWGDPGNKEGPRNEGEVWNEEGAIGNRGVSGIKEGAVGNEGGLWGLKGGLGMM